MNLPSFVLCVFILFLSPLAGLSQHDLEKIGDKIWKNECHGTVYGLTHWKKGENFASLGIGHFIWYPAQKRECFQETFPDLLLFCLQHHVDLPIWLRSFPACPWHSREDFYAHFQSERMCHLRQFLYQIRSQQVLFIAQRLERALPSMLSSLPTSQQKKMMSHFSDLQATKYGMYALLDYLNFKGSGLSEQERYQGKGWGLFQVLQSMSTASLEDFVGTAKSLLTERVKNSPPERKEEKWLQGWLNRLDTYLDTSW